MKIMNKILREETEYLITCDDKYITPDVRDDVKMTLDYIDELENKINKAIDYIENNDLYTQDYDYDYDDNMVLSPPTDELERKELLDILRGEDNEN